jgi:hypothetical protein
VLTWTDTFSNETINRTDFIVDIRSNVDEDEADIVSDTQMNKWIDEGLRYVNQKVGLLPMYCEVACDGSASYTLPDGFTKQKTVEWSDGNENIIYLKKGTRSKIGEYGLVNSTGVASYFIREGNEIFIFGQVTTGTLRVYGAKMPMLPDDAANTSEYIDLPDDYLELLTLYVEWRYWKRAREADETRDAKQELREAVDDAKWNAEKDYGKGVTMFGKRTNNGSRR